MDTNASLKKKYYFLSRRFLFKVQLLAFLHRSVRTEDTINSISTWIHSSQKNNFLIGCTRRLIKELHQKVTTRLLLANEMPGKMMTQFRSHHRFAFHYSSNLLSFFISVKSLYISTRRVPTIYYKQHKIFRLMI